MTTIQQKNKPSSIKDRENRLRELSKFNRDTLKAMTVNQLRESASWLIPNIRRLKKDELIDKIIEVTESYREESKVKIAQTIEYYQTSEINEDYLLEKYLNNYSPTDVAFLIVSLWESPIGKKSVPSLSTIVKTKPKQLRHLLDSLRANYPNSIEWCDVVYEQVKLLIAEKQKFVNQEYREKVENYGDAEHTRIINYSMVLDWAKSVIENAVNKDKLGRGEWYLLSFALSLTSGRRMVELHGTSEYIEYPLYYELREDKIFVSQLAKSLPNKSLLFTPLIDSELWIKAYQKLPEDTKGMSDEKVNNSASRNIAKNQAFKEVLEKLGFTTESVKGQYKDARDFYISYMKQIEYQDSNYGSSVKFAQDAIGHETKKTSLSYDKFKLV